MSTMTGVAIPKADDNELEIETEAEGESEPAAKRLKVSDPPQMSQISVSDGENGHVRTLENTQHYESLSDTIFKRWEKRQYCNLRLIASAGKETLADEEFKKMKQVVFHKDGLVEIDLHQIIASQSPQLSCMMQDKDKASGSERDMSSSLQIGFDKEYIEAGALVRCVKFMYTGKLGISSRNVTALLNASHYLGLEKAENLCIQFMVQTLNPANALSLAAIGKLLNCGDLEDKADYFLSQNFTAVSKTEEWRDLRATAVEAILRRSDLVCRSEMDVIDAIYRWGIAPFTAEIPKNLGLPNGNNTNPNLNTKEDSKSKEKEKEKDKDKEESQEDDDETVDTRLGTVCDWLVSDLVRCVHLSKEELDRVETGHFFNAEAKRVHADIHEKLLEACAKAVKLERTHRYDRRITREIPELRQYDYDRGNLIRRNCCEDTLEGHTGYVNTVREVDSGILASGSRDQTIMVWSLAEKKLLKTLEGHRDRIWKIERFSNKAHRRLLLSCSFDSTARVWDPNNDYACIKVLSSHTSWVVSATIWKDKIVTGSADNSIKIWNLDSFDCERTLSGHQDHVYGLCTVNTVDHSNRNVEYLASGSQDKTLKIWDSATWSCIQTLNGHAGSVRCVIQFGNYLISGSEDRVLRIWDTSTWRCVEMMTGHTNVIEALSVLHDTDMMLLASASRDNTIKLWDVDRKCCVKTMRGHTNWVKTLDVTSEGKLVSGSADNKIKIWNHKL